MRRRGGGPLDGRADADAGGDVHHAHERLRPLQGGCLPPRRLERRRHGRLGRRLVRAAGGDGPWDARREDRLRRDGVLAARHGGGGQRTRKRPCRRRRVGPRLRPRRGRLLAARACGGADVPRGDARRGRGGRYARRDGRGRARPAGRDTEPLRGEGGRSRSKRPLRAAARRRSRRTAQGARRSRAAWRARRD